MQVLVRPMGLFLFAASLALAGCSSNKAGKLSTPMYNSKGESLAGFAGKGSAYLKGSGPVPRGGGKYHVGKPYQVAGRWFRPKAQPGYDRQGAASWYGEAFHRRKTSNGEYFDMNMLSAAHPTLPLPSYAKVTNLENGRSVIVRINDRGPFVGTRIIDVSKRAADALDFRNKGKADVRVQWIGNAPLDDDGNHLTAMNAKLNGGGSVKSLLADTSRGEAQGRKKTAYKSWKKSKPEKPVATMESSTDAHVLIRVGTFSSLENAQAVFDQVSAMAPAQLTEVNGDNGTNRYKVQIGPFLSRIGAEDVLAQLQAEGFPDAVVVKRGIQLAEVL